jgi:2-methylisocitrate lyase-like PEP mutase family enzyme
MNMNAAISAEVLAAANAKSRELKRLVAAPEILVMPGAYDVISAQLFQHLGFKAIQGTSGGIAAAAGYADGEVIARTDTLNITGEMARSVDVPVNADGEKGYGDAEETAWLVREFVGRGVAGMNLEDSAHPGSSGERRLVPLESHLEKIRAVVSTRSSLNSEFFLNARVDAFLIEDSPAACLAEAILRGNAYAGLGADCIFFINVTETEVMARLVKEIAAPVSILWREGAPSVAQLQDIGVARVSYGSAFARMAVGAVRSLAEEILEHGTCELLGGAITTPELRQLLRTKRND